MSGILSLLIGRVLNERYRIDSILGRGGMGAVCRAYDVKLQRDVAVKVMTAEAADAHEQRLLRVRFHREARAAARLRHPNVVTIHDYGTDESLGIDFLVMELLNGQDVRARLRHIGGPLPLGEVLQIAREAAQGLAAGHRAGLVHRDVKPGNLFLPSDSGARQVKVLDFGIAQMLSDAETRLTSGLLHTPRYASPEQLSGVSTLTPASDVYSLALTVLETLAGEYPTGLNSLARLPAPSVSSVTARGGASIPPRLLDTLIRALDPDPVRRVADAEAFLASLVGASSETMTAARSLPADKLRTILIESSTEPVGVVTKTVDGGEAATGSAPTNLESTSLSPEPNLELTSLAPEQLGHTSGLVLPSQVPATARSSPADELRTVPMESPAEPLSILSETVRGEGPAGSAVTSMGSISLTPEPDRAFTGPAQPPETQAIKSLKPRFAVRSLWLSMLSLIVVGMTVWTVTADIGDRSEIDSSAVTEKGTGVRGETPARALERAGALIQSGDTAGAVAEYESVLRLNPTSYAAEFYLGLVAFQRQNTEEAVRRWQRVVSIIDELPADSSADVMQERTETRGNTLNAQVLASAQYLNRQQPAQAAELLAELTLLLPNNPEAWYNYALALNNLQRYTELVLVAQRTLEIAPLSYGAWVLYYNSYAGQSQAATQGGQMVRAGELGRQARQISARSEGLPVQLEGVTIDVEAENTHVRGTAVGTGPTAPVQVEFTLHGASGELGNGTVTITPPARDQQSRFELTIPNSAAVLGVTYRVVGS